jgi:hypothetical protein
VKVMRTSGRSTSGHSRFAIGNDERWVSGFRVSVVVRSSSGRLPVVFVFVDVGGVGRTERYDRTKHRGVAFARRTFFRGVVFGSRGGFPLGAARERLLERFGVVLGVSGGVLAATRRRRRRKMGAWKRYRSRRCDSSRDAREKRRTASAVDSGTAGAGRGISRAAPDTAFVVESARDAGGLGSGTRVDRNARCGKRNRETRRRPRSAFSLGFSRYGDGE